VTSNKLVATVAALLVQSLSSAELLAAEGPIPTDADLAVGSASSSGSVSVLIYNVAGLPQGISQSAPLLNMPRISARLNVVHTRRWAVQRPRDDCTIEAMMVQCRTLRFTKWRCTRCGGGLWSLTGQQPWLARVKQLARRAGAKIGW